MNAADTEQKTNAGSPQVAGRQQQRPLERHSHAPRGTGGLLDHFLFNGHNGGAWRRLALNVFDVFVRRATGVVLQHLTLVGYDEDDARRKLAERRSRNGGNANIPNNNNTNNINNNGNAAAVAAAVTTTGANNAITNTNNNGNVNNNNIVNTNNNAAATTTATNNNNGNINNGNNINITTPASTTTSTANTNTNTNTNNGDGLKLIFVADRVKVYANEEFGPDHPLVQADAFQLLQLCALSNENQPKNIDCIAVPWLFPMLMHDSIRATQWNFIQIENVQEVDAAFSHWLASHVGTIQMVRCSFEDSGYSLCASMRHYSSTIHTIKFMSTEIDRHILAQTIAHSTKLKSFNVQDKRSHVNDGWWGAIVNDGLALNTSVKHVFLSGRCADNETLVGIYVALLGRPVDCTCHVFLSAIGVPPTSAAEQTQAIQAIRAALCGNPHAVTVNHPGLLVSRSMWNDEVEAVIGEKKRLRSVHKAMESMRGRNARYCSKVQSMMLSALHRPEHPSADLIFGIVKMQSLLLW